MATDIDPATTGSPSRPQRGADSGWAQWLAPIASLKLTVVLFAFSILLVFVGTLAQDKLTMWDVLERYFRTWIAWMPLDVWFPESFFPNMPEVPGVLPIPGGYLLGCLLGLNLAAAHLVRFKVQGKGRDLYWGTGLMALGGLITAAIVMVGNGANGLSEDPLLSWEAIWGTLRWGTAGLWVASVFWVLQSFGSNDRTLWVKIVGSISLGGVAFWLVAYGATSRFDNASLRILFQLGQGTLAGLVLLAGAWFVFRKRAGIVVIHLGVGLLMFGELLVSLNSVEEKMFIREGETISYTSESRFLEFQVIDRSSPDHDRVVTIPLHKLQSGDIFQHDDLPVDLQLVAFYKNSEVLPLKKSMQGYQPRVQNMKNLATTGIGLSWLVEEARQVGTNSELSDAPAAYVRLIPKDEGEVQTVLLAHLFGDARISLGRPADINETIRVGASTYDFALRYRRNYKPFQITLEDIRKEDYLGTNTVRDYSSYVVLNHAANNVANQRTRIWMNNPLRYDGKTFYQTGYHDLRDGTEATSLQIVTNVGWMIPYISCMLVVVGLLSHFSMTLSRFIDRQTRPSATQPAVELAKPRSWAAAAIIPAIAASLFLCFLVSPMRSKPTIVDGMNLDEFGKLPIVHGGRAKPIDTLARTALKVVSTKQTYTDTTIDTEDRMPAIKWFLDVVTRSPAADQHRVFYIPNFDVIELLGLQPRKRYTYSIDEFRDQLIALDEQVKIAKSTPNAQKSTFHLKTLETSQRIQRLLVLREAFTPMPFPDLPVANEENRAEAEATMREIIRLAMETEEYNKRLMQTQPPLVVPTAGKPTRWLPFGAAVNEAYVAQVMHGEQVDEQTLAWNNILSAYATGDADEFNREVREYQERLAMTPSSGVDNDRVQFETFYNRVQPFYWCMALYIFAFILNSVGWLGWYESFRRLSFWLLIFTLGLHTLAVVARIYISGRPPVTSLHSSALFIGWGGVLLCLVLERLYRLSIGNVVAAVFGFVSLFIAHNLAGEGDTFTVLQAVLDTQFWLATHVVTISLGYSTTFVAGGFATIYVLGSVFSNKITPEIGKTLIRMTYGVICFAIFFSFFGTVLGGLWADDSWGRFWGWDPKENGALIIVLWNALVLHARWGGMVRDRGFALLAIAGNICTVWSWFGVNELGIGLHAYGGFESSTKQTMALYVFSQLALVGLGLIPLKWWRSRNATSAAVA